VTFSNSGNAHWLSFNLPRQPLTSHLGFEPQGCTDAAERLHHAGIVTFIGFTAYYWPPSQGRF
jgi:hypothetical protein